MIKTKQYDRLEAALDHLCRDYNLAFPVKLFGLNNAAHNTMALIWNGTLGASEIKINLKPWEKVLKRN